MNTNTANRADAGIRDSRLQAFALCTLCNAEFGPNMLECPKCQVPLSVVRRCYSCSNVVSAKHRRCIHCGLEFFSSVSDDLTPDDRDERIAALRRSQERKKRRYRMRAVSVSVGTFLTVLFLVLYVTHHFEIPIARTAVIATSYVLNAADIHNAASSSSSNIGMVDAGSVVEVTDFQESDNSTRWIAVRWKDGTGYMEASSISPPKPTSADRGFELLKFYILGIENPAIIRQAVKAVDYFNKTFPGTSGEELRFVLAEKARSLAAEGKSPDELMKIAHDQYEILIAQNGSFAGKAREAMNGKPTSRPRQSHGDDKAGGSAAKAKDSGLTVQPVGGFGQAPTHEVFLLEKANIAVRLTLPATVDPEASVPCSVSREVRSGGQIVIPSGAPCQLRISDVKENKVGLSLSSVSVNDRSYVLRTSRAVVNKARASGNLTFRLETPVAIAH